MSRLTSKKNVNREEWSLLTNVGQEFEIGLIKGIMAESGVPVLVKSKGSGAYTSVYMGMSITGYDLYVPSSRLSEARKLMDDIEPIESSEMIEPEYTTDQTGGYILKHRDLFKKLFIVLFIIPSLLGILFVLFQEISRIL